MSSEINDMLKAILEAVNVNSAKIDALSDRMDRVEGRVEGLEVRMDKLEAGQTALRHDLESFRLETSMNFRKLDRHVRMVEADLDLTIERVQVLENSSKA